MIVDWAVAFLHFFFILVSFGLLVAELVVFKRTLSPNDARWLRRLDVAYFIAILLLIGTGLLRLFYFGKGTAFYLSQVAFDLKMLVLIAVGAFSIPPTVAFLRLKPVIDANRTVVLSDRQFRRVRACIFAEIGLFLTIPLLATLMARGGLGSF